VASYPENRPRRLRKTPALRRLARETVLTPDNLVYPIFIREGERVREPIASMPGQFRYSPDTVVDCCGEVFDLGIPAVIFFGIPDRRDACGSEAWNPAGVICRAVERVKNALPDLCVITDVCLCEYTDHGHCGIVRQDAGDAWEIDNDATLPLLAREALAHVNAGADMVAPSDMMDGRVAVIRRALNTHGFSSIPVMAYSAKHASAFYGPFREAAGSAPRFGDRRSYQMDPANRKEALREMRMDAEEGADILMVKPALPCLDLIRDAAERFDIPIAAYNVSGEYAMLKAAAERGWLDERASALESLLAIRRAGASIILTYWAPQAARWLREYR